MKGSTGAVFLATTDRVDANDVIVKFVEFYGEDVHRKMSNEKMAPELHAVIHGHTFKMVVMDFESDAHMWNPDVDGVDDNKKMQLQNILRKLEQEEFVQVTYGATTCWSVATAL